jgi:ribosomal protein L37AE/L43A
MARQHAVDAKFLVYSKVWYCRSCGQTLTDEKQHKTYPQRSTVDPELKRAARALNALLDVR